MKNNRTINILIIIVVLITLSCKKASDGYSKAISQSEPKNSIIDTLTVEIDDNYNLKTIIGDKQEKIDFFEPIKDKLINESVYAQILYDKKNVIINLEIGQNADIYEDFYLSKKQPLEIEKIVRTTIEKTNELPKKLVCEETVNKPILQNSRYRNINDKLKSCKSEKMQ